MTGKAVIIRSDARNLPLPDASVDLIVTSPPYFGLRSYRDNGEHYEGQVGSEATPQEFLQALWGCMQEWWRVLKPEGSCFVNLGDKRAGSGGGNQSGLLAHRNPAIQLVHDAKVNQFDGPRRYNQASFGRTKSKMLIPHRFAIGCEDGLADPEGIGWVMRQEIVWCLSGGAKVYARTPSGDRPMMIRDLYRSYRPENVQLWNGQQWTQCLGWSQTPADKTALELELRSGERIGCTRNHQWPTQRGLLRADQLTIGDVLETTKLPEPRQVEHAGLPDEDIGWFVGLFLAEGSRSGTMMQIAGHQDETLRMERLKRIAAAYDGRAAVYRVSENGVTCNLSGTVLSGILDRYVSRGTAATKRLTVHAWQRSNEFLAAVMEGYLDGDGHFDAKNDRWRIGFTDNDEWASDLRTLAARLGTKISLRRAIYKVGGREFPGWRGEWRWTHKAHHNARAGGQIVAIRASRARDFYDIGVAEGPHLFALASGVLTHNSKLNGLPESVTDRHRDSHEYIFHFTKQERYFAAMDEVRQAHLSPLHSPGQKTITPDRNDGDRNERIFGNPLGKLPGSVWPMASEPLLIPQWAKDKYGLGDHFACVDTETEVLTEHGWLRHDEVRIGDQVAGYNLDLGIAEWTTCHGVHRYDFDGEMVAVDKRDLSMRLTTNHRQVVQKQLHNKTRGPVHVVDAGELKPSHFILRSAEWGQFESKSIGPDLAALCGWVASEGWYQNDSVSLSQSSTANPHKVEEIDALLGRFPDRLAERYGRKTYRVAMGFLRRREAQRTYRGQEWTDVSWRLPLWLSAEVQDLMPDKLLPWSFVGLPEDERRAVLDAFIAGDGHRRVDGRTGIFQKVRHNLDVLQAIAVTLGYKTTLRRGTDKWALFLTLGGRSITLRGTAGTTKPIPREHYKGIVWCPTTGTGTWFARRNGSVFITGNSFPTELPRKLILGFSPSGICVECGEPRRPVTEYGEEYAKNRGPGTDWNRDRRSAGQGYDGNGDRRSSGPPLTADRRITGYACACPTPEAPTRPSVVLDPFGGTGTVAMVAKGLGRIGISNDLSQDYCNLARWRIEESGHGKKAEQRTWRERQETFL